MFDSRNCDFKGDTAAWKRNNSGSTNKFIDNKNLTTFSLSKLTGHAGSSFGWELIKDEEVYERMRMYTQLRTLKLLNAVLHDGGRANFEYGHRTMSESWKRLRDAVSVSDRFSVLRMPPRHCLYFNETRDLTPAYSWVKCERDEGRSCNEVMRAGNIAGRTWSVFEVKDRQERPSLIRSADNFDVLVTPLRRLAAAEDGPQII